MASGNLLPAAKLREALFVIVKEPDSASNRVPNLVPNRVPNLVPNLVWMAPIKENL